MRYLKIGNKESVQYKELSPFSWLRILTRTPSGLTLLIAQLANVIVTSEESTGPAISLMGMIITNRHILFPNFYLFGIWLNLTSKS